MKTAFGAALAALAFVVSCSKESAPPERGAGAEPKGAPAASKPPEAKPAAQDVIRIGEVGSMTGPQATFGVSTHRGILLAVDKANAKGGVKGKKIQVIPYDDQGKPEEAAAAATKLIAQDKVHAILGEVASTLSLFMADVAQKAGVPMVSPSSTNPKVTEKGDYIFRVCFIDPFQGEVMAKFARNTLKLSRVAVLRDVRNDYSVGLADFFVDAFKKLGGTITSDESYSAGDVDFRAQLTALRGKKPEAIYVPGYYTDVGLIAKQARDLGIKVPLLGGDGWDSTKLHELGGDAIVGSYFSNHYSVDDPSPRIQAFVEEYRKAYGEVPDGLAALGYDAAQILIEALARAPDLSGPAIRDALAATKGFQGVTGDISINEKRDAVKSAVVLKVEPGGKYSFVERIEPTLEKATAQ